MKILNLSTYYYPEQIASSHLLSDLEEAYEANNFEVILHVPTPTRGITSEMRDKYKKIKYEERRNGCIKIFRFTMFGEYKNPLIRALRYFLIQVKQYFRFIKIKKADLVYCSSTPPTQGLLGVLVKRKLEKLYKRKIPCIYVLQDIFPESLVSTGLSRRNSIVYKLGDVIANYTYKNVDKIIVISEDFKHILINKNVPCEKIELIHNWVDENKVINIPRDENKLFDEYNLDRNKFYISYSGNIGLTQNMDMLLDVAKELKNNNDIRFILVGDGAYKSQVEKRIKEEKISNVTLIPFQPYERISEVFSLGDVGLIISKKGVGSNSVPSKTWSYMSAERPILASFDIDSELCRVIKDNDCGICMEAGNREGLSETILYLQEKKNVYYGVNGKKYLKENLGKKNCVQKYINVLSSMQE